MTTRLTRRREAQTEWMPQSAHVPKERKLWQALYSAVGEYELALRVCDKIILWPVSRPEEHYLRRWATEIQMHEATADPALEKVMAGCFERYKSNRHWEFIEGQIRAANRIAREIEEKGETKSAAAVSYLGANANYGMDKGSHAPAAPKTQQINVGNVKIISNRKQPAITREDNKRARKLLGPQPVDAEYRMVE